LGNVTLFFDWFPTTNCRERIPRSRGAPRATHRRAAAGFSERPKFGKPDQVKNAGHAVGAFRALGGGHSHTWIWGGKPGICPRKGPVWRDANLGFGGLMLRPRRDSGFHFWRQNPRPCGRFTETVGIFKGGGGGGGPTEKLILAGGSRCGESVCRGGKNGAPCETKTRPAEQSRGWRFPSIRPPTTQIVCKDLRSGFVFGGWSPEGETHGGMGGTTRAGPAKGVPLRTVAPRGLCRPPLVFFPAKAVHPFPSTIERSVFSRWDDDLQCGIFVGSVSFCV